MNMLTRRLIIAATTSFVLAGHAFAQEGMARNLAVGADLRTALNLDERPDPGPGANPAPVQVDELRVVNDHLIFKDDTIRDRHHTYPPLES